MIRHAWKKFVLLSLSGAFLLSCAPTHTPTRKEKARPDDEVIKRETAPISKQLSSALKDGLSLSFSSFSFSIPSKVEETPNRIRLDSGSAFLRLDSPSLHGLEAQLDLPLDYNGVKKQFDLTLFEESLYFSLTDENSDFSSGYGGIRFRSSTSSIFDDEKEYDDLTRGRCYYEYGSLDYFLCSVFEAFEIPSFSLSRENFGKVEIDMGAIMDSFDEITSVSPNSFRLDLPLGEEIIPIGLYSDANNRLNRIRFPYQEDEYKFSNDLGIGFNAAILSVSSPFSIPFPEDSYLKLEDSLELVERFEEITSKKAFGLDANITISHIEEEVIGDDEHFARDEINELGTLTGSVDADLSSSYHDVNASLSFAGQESNEKIALHFDDDSGKPQCYFNFNEVLQGYCDVSTISNLFSTIMDALGDESIQNQVILRFIAGVIATSDSLKEALDAIKNSFVAKDIEEGHYEDVLASLESLGHVNNAIYAVLNLSNSGGTGKIRLTFDARTESLGKVEFFDAGISTNNTPSLKLLLNGSLDLRGYAKKSFDKSSYTQYEHLPSLTDSISRFAQSDQLSISFSGYLSHRGTTANVAYSLPSYNGNLSLNTQGFSFSGDLGFDLRNKLGTGKMTIEDHEENYFNDHNIKMDVTGGALDSDSDAKDYAGSEGETGYMLFEYDSKNNSSTGTRTSPSNDSLKGRFSVHSLDGILDIVAELLTSTDPRFKRLTNLFSNVMDASTLGTIISGRYIEALSGGFLSASEVDISANSASFIFKPGLVKEDYNLSLRVRFEDDYRDEEGVLRPGKIKTLEIYSTAPSLDSEGSDIYAKIEFKAAAMPSFNFFGKSGYSYSSFTSYSSFKHLLSYLLDTITLGVTDTSTVTTYYLRLDIGVKIIGLINKSIYLDAFIFLDGTNIKILATAHYDSITAVIADEGVTSIFYETSGEDSSGDLYIARSLKSSNLNTYRRVTGENFFDNLGKWLVYIFDFSNTIKDALESDSSGKKAIHGEDLILGYQTNAASGSSFPSPSWKITLGLNSLLPDNVLSFIKLGSLPLTVQGKTVTYSSGGKNYSKQSLYSFSGSLDNMTVIGINAISATVSASIKNIASGNYTNAWTSGSTQLYEAKSSGIIIKRYSISTLGSSATPSSIFSGSNGKSNSNSNYKNTGYSITP